MKKIDIIKEAKDFDYIINHIPKKRNKYFSIFYLSNKEKNHYGISVPKKLGIAVIRNKKKRQIKNIIDKNKKILPKYYDYVIILKKELLELTYLEMEENLLSLFKQIKEN